MTVDLSKARIFIRPGHTDLRKAVNGLSVLIQEAMNGEPFSGDVYLFCNKGRKLLKALWWDKTGFWLSQKRLERERWPWPENAEAVEELSREQLGMLLEGIDFFKAHKRVYYQRVS
jgi:transposase